MAGNWPHRGEACDVSVMSRQCHADMKPQANCRHMLSFVTYGTISVLRGTYGPDAIVLYLCSATRVSLPPPPKKKESNLKTHATVK